MATSRTAGRRHHSRGVLHRQTSLDGFHSAAPSNTSSIFESTARLSELLPHREREQTRRAQAGASAMRAAASPPPPRVTSPSLLHSQFALAAALFIAQAETAELTAVMSLALMECFVPPCVCVHACGQTSARAPPAFRAGLRKGSSAQEPRWLTVEVGRREGMRTSAWSAWSSQPHAGVPPPASAGRCADRQRRFPLGEANVGVMTGCG